MEGFTDILNSDCSKQVHFLLQKQLKAVSTVSVCDVQQISLSPVTCHFLLWSGYGFTSTWRTRDLTQMDQKPSRLALTAGKTESERETMNERRNRR
ncbi:uncharacterized protein LOC144301748 isoform X2 [Canis aureus]